MKETLSVKDGAVIADTSAAYVPPGRLPTYAATKIHDSDPQPTNARYTRIYLADALDEAEFARVWLTEEPLVVYGLRPRLRQGWDPTYFKEKHGDQSCTLVDCQDKGEITRKRTVREFFDSFGAYENRGNRSWKLKVRIACVPFA
jgi:hypothetical protein